MREFHERFPPAARKRKISSSPLNDFRQQRNSKPETLMLCMCVCVCVCVSVFLSLSSCAENTEEEDVSAKLDVEKKKQRASKPNLRFGSLLLQQEQKRTNVLISISKKRKTKKTKQLCQQYIPEEPKPFFHSYTQKPQNRHTHIHSSVHRRMQTRVPRNPTLFTSAQLLQHTSELVVSAQLMFFQWRWRDQLPCCCC